MSELRTQTGAKILRITCKSLRLKIQSLNPVIFEQILRHGKMNRGNYYIMLLSFVVGVVLILIAVWLYSTCAECPDRHTFRGTKYEYREAYRKYEDDEYKKVLIMILPVVGFLFFCYSAGLYATSDSGKRWIRYFSQEIKT